ncbi:MAG: hypothetical protein RSD44_08060 [Akkermansia sp.]
MTPLVFVCGEGVSDFGNQSEKGPLYYVIWKILQKMCGEDNPHEKICIIEEGYLKSKRRQWRGENPRKSMLLKRSGDGNDPKSWDREAAAQTLAKVTCEEGGDLAVLHSDVDFTRKELDAHDRKTQKLKRQEFRDAIRNTIKRGFEKGGLGIKGVPLVPMPRSEAWLIHMAPDNKKSPEQIELLPGNDNAANEAKTLLKSLGYITVAQKADLVFKKYTPEKMYVESHNVFWEDMQTALQEVSLI